jgi:hypothetical protein
MKQTKNNEYPQRKHVTHGNWPTFFLICLELEMTIHDKSQNVELYSPFPWIYFPLQSTNINEIAKLVVLV